MFRCPLCGASARIRTSRPENDSNTVRQKYYQCNNLEMRRMLLNTGSFP
ncbi:DNA-binding transcriptional regulator prophage remnant [Escherichia coli]|uniref:DNA-binding transcriptional regulator prophage remnant n=1 Tax=Escherichia coli TaxID=562 RepID=A0A2X3KEP8_ECOLX|nr:DNA-binding transcriptional regulator prophage remnant [Escherichia coli]